MITKKQLTTRDCQRCVRYRKLGRKHELPVWWNERCANAPSKNDDVGEYTRYSVNGPTCRFEEAAR